MLLASSILGLSSLSGVHAQQPSKPECIAPAQPGGGFDLTCRVAVNGFLETKLLENAMRTVYMPGGVGAVAYNHIVAQRPGDGNAIAAFSGGSLLNLAQGKFGKYSVEDVRWLASIGSDYGVAIVRNDSPYQDLKSLMEAFKADPSKIVLGAGGSVGGQDWMKAALTARAADVDFRKMRFVAFEGGGEAITALRGGHVQAYMGDAAEAHTMLEGGLPSAYWPCSMTSDWRVPWLMFLLPKSKALILNGRLFAVFTLVPKSLTSSINGGFKPLIV